MFGLGKRARITAPERVILPGDPPVDVLLKPSRRARRLSLRVSHLDGRVTLTVPEGAARDEALDFAHLKAEWIRGHLAAHPGQEAPGIGGSVLYRGAPHRIEAAALRGVRAEAGRILVPATRPEATPARLAAFLKTEARSALADASDRHAARLGRPYGRLTLRDTRSRWGSCSSDGNLMYSWRLIMAPPEVLDYVAAHEVAHLAHMDHSPAFWSVVEQLYPRHKPARRWLRENGAQLHRYVFHD